MRKGIEARLRRIWRGDPTASDRLMAGALLPAALLFRIGAGVRGAAYDRGIFRVRHARIPVISVGNLAVGGTGKTPVAAWLAAELVRRGHRPALVARGYGEDELLLHRRWNPQVPLFVAPKRIDGVGEAARAGCDIAIVDDGFQHRALARDLDLLLLSPGHAFPGELLPTGPYRESWKAIRRAHHILVTAKGELETERAQRLVGIVASLPGAPPVTLFPLEAGEWCNVDGILQAPPPEPPLVVTSVAQGEPYAQLVDRRSGGIRGHLAFPDHHSFTRADIARIVAASAGSWVAATEKDAVKLVAFRELLPELRVLPLVPAPPGGLADRFLDPFADSIGTGRAE